MKTAIKITALALTSIVWLALTIPSVGADTFGKKQMVAAANSHATEAGIEILRAGGNAVDAAIAMELVLTLVEPQSSGIGGGGFIMHRLADGTMEAWDGRETAPMAMQPDAFLKADGTTMGFFEAAFGGLPVGVPGMMRMFGDIHAEHGKLPWADVFQPAIRLSQEGFQVSPRLNYLLTTYGVRVIEGGLTLDKIGAAGAYFFDENSNPRPVGYLLKNPAYAASLKTIASKGADSFYTGTIADEILTSLAESQVSPSSMTADDLKNYAAIKRDPVCGPYRDHKVCSMGPPSSGATTLLSILGMLEHFDVKGAGAMTPKSIHLFSEASKLAYADREKYSADPAFASVPVEGLLDPQYLKARAALIDPNKAATNVTAGALPMNIAMADHVGPDYPSTTHMVVVDKWGNSVSFTATVQAAFGSLVMSGGFLLNNELTDFSFKPEADGLLVANRPEGGKRPRSSMTPVIVEDSEGELDILIGSPGGSRIISYVAKSLIGIIDWNLSVQDAINLPNIVNRSGQLELERGKNMEVLKPGLGALGHMDIQVRNLNSGVHAISVHRDDGGVSYRGGADPRREGNVRAD